jgi:catechol 2,3-dioxygenase-like lactoylglutathione lyase family enzyme
MVSFCRSSISRVLFVPVAFVALGFFAAGCSCMHGAKTPANEFASAVVDVGTVVSDIEKSAAFYRDVLGFRELEGFDVPAELGAAAGLSDGKPFHVRKFVLDEGATTVKLMQFADAPGSKVDNSFLHSSFGFRYLTIRVKDMAESVARARKAGGVPIAKCPVLLPDGLGKGVYLTCFKDPDGHLVDFVGPASREP